MMDQNTVFATTMKNCLKWSITIQHGPSVERFVGTLPSPDKNLITTLIISLVFLAILHLVTYLSLNIKRSMLYRHIQWYNVVLSIKEMFAWWMEVVQSIINIFLRDAITWTTSNDIMDPAKGSKIYPLSQSNFALNATQCWDCGANRWDHGVFILGYLFMVWIWQLPKL